ncbi:MAG: hypothetical protein KDA24_07475 [Deltaproteobacteria bacterium]|nr:hypothetical protein [Deltaproteobacteria bacterium]
MRAALPTALLGLVLCLPLRLTAYEIAPQAVRDEAALRSSLADFNAGARFPLPALTDAQLERLAAGKVLKVRQVSEDGDEPQRAIGLLRTAHPAAALWLSARDVHFTAVDELVEVKLTPPAQWPAVWYQLLDMPRPFSDRHWVVDVTDTHSLATATGGRCWEHAWVLSEHGPTVAADAVGAGRVPGIDSDRIEDAIYTPVNHGAWLVIDLGDGTSLLGYHVTSVIGGAIPDKLVADYTLFTLGKMLKGVAERVPTVVDHYDAAHPPIEGGDGKALPPKLRP